MAKTRDTGRTLRIVMANLGWSGSVAIHDQIHRQAFAQGLVGSGLLLEYDARAAIVVGTIADLSHRQPGLGQRALGGRAFRNYGEFNFPRIIPPKAGWSRRLSRFADEGRQDCLPTLDRPGNPASTVARIIPAGICSFPIRCRIVSITKEFREYEKSGDWPNLVIVYLPQDHTSRHQRQRFPRLCAMVADNDLAVGRLVEAISHSRYWAKTVLFVNEDDPQDGWDHVDGHRSLCLVVGPYVSASRSSAGSTTSFPCCTL